MCQSAGWPCRKPKTGVKHLEICLTLSITRGSRLAGQINTGHGPLLTDMWLSYFTATITVTSAHSHKHWSHRKCTSQDRTTGMGTGRGALCLLVCWLWSAMPGPLMRTEHLFGDRGRERQALEELKTRGNLRPTSCCFILLFCSNLVFKYKVALSYKVRVLSWNRRG